MDRNEHRDIRIGILTRGDKGIDHALATLLPHGFESFSITFGEGLGGTD